MKTALIFGSTGLIGGILLKLLASDQKYTKIKVFVRSYTSKIDPKIEVIQTDFTKLENIKSKIKGDDCFFCIGTTRKKTPNKQDYINTEYNLPITIGKICSDNNVQNFTYISSLGASSKKTNWWNHRILQTETQISPLSGSVKKQNIEFLGKEKIKLYNKEYDVEHFRLFSTNPNLPDDKKLNFEIWYDKKKALIIKVAYKRLGLWEYRLKEIQ